MEHLLQPADTEVATLRFALDQIGMVLSTTKDPPHRSLPEVATELMRVVQNPRADAAAIEKIVARDPFISAQVLSVANSALYAPITPISGIRDAAVRIGMEAVRDIALMVVTTSRMFRVAGLEKQTLVMCNRSVVTAVAARRLAQILGANNDYAFLAGLLHDVGHLLFLEEAAKAGLTSRRVLGNAALLQVLLEKSGQYHQPIGAAACTAWGLPQAAAQSAMFHHRYLHEGKHYIAAHLVAVADVVADALGVGALPVTISPTSPPFSDLGIKPEMVKALIEETRAITASMGVQVSK